VLISNKVNIWREIAADGAGLVAPDTLAGTSQTLATWLGFTAVQRAAMAQQAKQCFVQRFHMDAAAAKLQQVLDAHG
jgi:hypothetical protein